MHVWGRAEGLVCLHVSDFECKANVITLECKANTIGLSRTAKGGGSKKESGDQMMGAMESAVRALLYILHGWLP